MDMNLYHPYSTKSKLAALLLCFFLGGLGLHRFYIGRKQSGLVMLALTIVGAILTLFGIGIINGLVSLWALVDFVRLCIGHLTDAEDKPLKFGN